MKAVLVVDMVRDFVTGKLGGPDAQAIVPRLRALLERARARGVPVVYVCDAHRPDDPEMKVWGEHSMEGTEGAEIVEELAPAEGDLVFRKRAYDAFTNPEVDAALRERGVDALLVTGVATNICVQNTAAGAAFRGYDLTVVEDCTAAPSEAEHRQGLKYMEEMYGARVAQADAAL